GGGGRGGAGGFDGRGGEGGVRSLGRRGRGGFLKNWAPGKMPTRRWRSTSSRRSRQASPTRNPSPYRTANRTKYVLPRSIVPPLLGRALARASNRMAVSAPKMNGAR